MIWLKLAFAKAVVLNLGCEVGKSDLGNFLKSNAQATTPEIRIHSACGRTQALSDKQVIQIKTNNNILI